MLRHKHYRLVEILCPGELETFPKWCCTSLEGHTIAIACRQSIGGSPVENTEGGGCCACRYGGWSCRRQPWCKSNAFKSASMCYLVHDLKVGMHVLTFDPHISNYQISFIPLYRQQNLPHACLSQTWPVDCKPCAFFTKGDDSDANHTTQINAASVDTSIDSFFTFV